MRRHEHDGRRRKARAHGLDELEPVHLGHLQVGQHDVGRALGDDLERLAPVLRVDRLHPGATRDEAPGEPAIEGRVVDDEDAGHARSGRPALLRGLGRGRGGRCCARRVGRLILAVVALATRPAAAAVRPPVPAGARLLHVDHRLGDGAAVLHVGERLRVGDAARIADGPLAVDAELGAALTERVLLAAVERPVVLCCTGIVAVGLRRAEARVLLASGKNKRRREDERGQGETADHHDPRTLAHDRRARYRHPTGARAGAISWGGAGVTTRRDPIDQRSALVRARSRDDAQSPAPRSAMLCRKTL